MRSLLFGLTFAGLACVPSSPAPIAPIAPTAPPADGALALPSDYRAWPKFLVDVQRPDAKQVRDIYVNPTGAATQAGSAFPNGTQFVMELYEARALPNGELATGADGRLVRGELKKIFLMAKGPGWGDGVAEPALRNGDWVYGALLPDGKSAAPDDPATCRACHLPHAGKDFVHRYDEYFATRGAR